MNTVKKSCLKHQYATICCFLEIREATRFGIIFQFIFMVYSHVKDRWTHPSFPLTAQAGHYGNVGNWRRFYSTTLQAISQKDNLLWVPTIMSSFQCLMLFYGILDIYPYSTYMSFKDLRLVQLEFKTQHNGQVVKLKLRRQRKSTVYI